MKQKRTVKEASQVALTQSMPGKDRAVANLLIVCFFSMTLGLPLAIVATEEKNPALSSFLREKIANPLRSSTTLISFWNLFAEIRDKNFHYSAVITFSDGSTKYYEFPRPQKMGYWERFQREKQRKVFFDCMNSPFSHDKKMISSFARFLAESNANPSNPPKKIVLTSHWVNTPPPGSGSIRDALPEHTQTESIFEYDCGLVKPSS